MDEKQTIIASELENTSLTQFSNSIHNQIEEYVSKHPGTSFMILGTNRKQGTDSLIGDAKAIAKEFLEIASSNDNFTEVLSEILDYLKQ